MTKFVTDNEISVVSTRLINTMADCQLDFIFPKLHIQLYQWFLVLFWVIRSLSEWCLDPYDLDDTKLLFPVKRKLDFLQSIVDHFKGFFV